MNGTTHIPGKELHSAVKAGLILHDTDLAKWCYQHGLSPQAARNALLGSWTGPAAIKLIQKLVIDSQADRLLAIKKNSSHQKEATNG